ncbi:MAG: AbrB/MazE/SpoVT family DNA-binding domain-containing protein [Caulobacterales bacterium]|uniref:AbrB/MazE/SpoVT family DNA-binding domain-containing protein n=1 Tax=Glycocaulis sp. TaxID=1969725 RepID=UPI003F9FA17A
MKALIGKWGQSQAVRLPREISENLKLQAGDEVEMELVNGKLVITPLKRPAKLDPKALFAQMEQCDPPAEIDWGPARGAEIW